MSPRASRRARRASPLDRVLDEIRSVAPSDAPVLLWGEPGVGKEHAARQLHALSPRRDRPFVAVRCFGLTAPTLHRTLHDSAPAENDLPDGHPMPGALQQARGGTLLLDGVESLDEAVQRELLLALLALRPASPSPRRLPPPRIVTSATEELLTRVRRGRFRRDLYHRLAVVRIHIPPLRQRRESLMALVDELLAEHAAAGLPTFTLAPDAQEAFRAYRWPGNVRELSTLLIQAAWRSGGTLHARDLEDLLERDAQTGSIHVPCGSTLAAAERLVIVETLAALAGNKKRTAEALGITRRTLYSKLASFGPLDSA